MSYRPGSAADYKPISDYGVIGDMHTAARVGLDGSIDWYCAPRFDSPSVFAALLDARKGGRFQLSPIDGFTTKQSYEGDTNVLSTFFFQAEDGIRDLNVTGVQTCALPIFQQARRVCRGARPARPAQRFCYHLVYLWHGQ